MERVRLRRETLLDFALDIACSYLIHNGFCYSRRAVTVTIRVGCRASALLHSHVESGRDRVLRGIATHCIVRQVASGLTRSDIDDRDAELRRFDNASAAVSYHVIKMLQATVK